MTRAYKAGLLALALVPLLARAEQWTVTNSFAARHETNDNAALAATSPGTMNTQSVSSTLSASRRSENTVSSLRAAMAALQERGPGERDRLDGQWGATQSYSDLLTSLDLSALYLQDINSGLVENADVLVGRSRRKSTQLNARASRQLHERWSVNLNAAQERTGYGDAGSADFRNTTLGGGLSFRHSELQTWSLDASQARYRTDDGLYRSTTDQAAVGWSLALGEQQSLSLSIGGYRTRSEGQRSVWVCPLEPSFCLFNGVPPVRVSEPAQDTQRGLQFNLSHRVALDETSDFALGAARQQSPSGAGVVARRDTLNAQLSHSFSPLSSGSLGLARTRATYHAFGGDVQRTEQSVSLSFTRRLAEDLSVQFGARHLRAAGSSPESGAQSNSITLSLQYDWPRLDVSR